MGTIKTVANGQFAAFDAASVIAVHTDGTLLAVFKDASVSAANIKLFSSADQGATWTQRANITAPVDINAVTTSQFTDGSIAIAARATDRLSIRYCKVTFGTWAVSAWQTVTTTGTTWRFHNFDVDVSDNGVVVVASQLHNGTAVSFNRITTRNTSGTWVENYNVARYENQGIRRASQEDVSICTLATTGGVLNFVVGFAGGTSSYRPGVLIYSGRVSESTGVLSGSILQRTIIHSNLVDAGRTSGRLHRVKITRVDTNEFLAGIVTLRSALFRVGPRVGHYRAQFAGTVWTELLNTQGSALALYEYTLPISENDALSTSISVDANKNLVARFIKSGGSNVSPRIVGAAIIWNNTTNAPYRTAFGFSYFAASSNTDVYSVSDGVKKNLAQSKMDFIYHTNTGTVAPIVSKREVIPNPEGLSAVKSLIPANGAGGNPANPGLGAHVDTDDQFSQSEYRVEFQFASDSSFTSNLITYQQSYAKSKLVNGTNTAGVTVLFSDVLPSAHNLTFGTWHYRARLVDLYGNVGSWSSSQTFLVVHPPTLVPTSPVGGGFYAWSGGLRTFTWNFTDPSSTDYQTAYELEIQSDEGAVIHNTGKILSSAQSFVYTIPVIHKDKTLNWIVRGWDSDDTQGEFSSPESFILTDPTTATIQTPTVDQIFDTGVPTFVFTPTTGGTRKIREYTVTVTQGTSIIWSKRVAATINSGTQQSVKMQQGYLKNNQNYSVYVSVIDSFGVQGASPIVAFSVAWIPPAAPTGLTIYTDQYNIEDEGYVLVEWDDLARDPDFVSWSLYRKDDLIDENGFVLEEGTWNLVFRDFSTGDLYAYQDYFAPSNYAVTYRALQSVNRIGQDMDSLPTDSEVVIPISDGYWLIEPSSDNVDSDAFKLSIVTGDTFIDEQEEEEFTVIGRGRVVNKGQQLGFKGQLDVQLRNTGGTTARQKRLRLKNIQQGIRLLWLRNPFGDIFKVNVSAMSIGRVSGVGSNEFCDVSIPYSEVS